jgi:predicted ester cyclase
MVRSQAEAQNKYDFDTVMSFFADNVSWTDPTGPCEGAEAVRTRYTNLYAAFPDGQVELGRVVEQGDLCMYEETFRGTNTGNLALPDGMSVPATGNPFAIDNMVLIRVEGERIAEYKIIFDQVVSMTALGVMPPPS